MKRGGRSEGARCGGEKPGSHRNPGTVGCHKFMPVLRREDSTCTENNGCVSAESHEGKESDIRCEKQ
jgi:hypothetical protein